MKILVSVVKEKDKYRVLRNDTNEFLKGEYYFDPAKEDEQRVAQLMAGAYATGYADALWPNR